MRSSEKRWTVPALGALTALILFAPRALSSDDPGRGPHRCIARWQQPDDACPLQGVVRAEGLGRNLKGAQRQAEENLLLAAEAVRQQQAGELPVGAQAIFLQRTQTCKVALPRHLATSCFPEPHLRAARYCYLELPDASCGQGMGFFLDGRAWREGELVRMEQCEQRIPSPFEEGDPRASACRALCWQEGSLRCGAASP